MSSINRSWDLERLINIFLKQQNNPNISSLYLEKIAELEKLKQETVNIPNILIVESNQEKFLAALLAGIKAEVNLFLCNPSWQKQEWQEVFKLVKPDFIWGKLKVKQRPNQTIIPPKLLNPIIAIPTGGTSGEIRFAMHTIPTLAASVIGFKQYFNTHKINSCCILPLYHVSGLMQFFRSFLTTGKLINFTYTDLKQDKKPPINPREFFISLVPTQLQFLLATSPQWLSNFQTVLLGGAPAWRSLLKQAIQYNLPLSLTYGMTETASGIVILKPEDFLLGNRSNGRVLSQAQIQILNCPDQISSPVEFSLKGKGESKVAAGIIQIISKSLCLGYYPKLFADNCLVTDDLGYFDTQGYLYLLGRNSQKIITGGENVFPSEVESAILASDLVQDVCVVGIPDEKWGQAVTAILVPQELDPNLELIRQYLRSRLSSYKQPKYWILTQSLPRNSQGKIKVTEMIALAQSWLAKNS